MTKVLAAAKNDRRSEAAVVCLDRLVAVADALFCMLSANNQHDNFQG